MLRASGACHRFAPHAARHNGLVAGVRNGVSSAQHAKQLAPRVAPRRISCIRSNLKRVSGISSRFYLLKTHERSSCRFFSSEFSAIDAQARVEEKEVDALLGVGCHKLGAQSNEYRKAMEKLLPLSRIRNFCIIAHVDHGKSTLADCLLRLTGNLGAATGHEADDVSSSTSESPSLDSLEVERQRGITVKAQTASMFVKHKGEQYLLNLIDTPGHVDFSFEVNRSLTVCEGCLLLIDSAQGIQAQTMAVFESALEAGLDIIPVLTKIDMASSNPETAVAQMESALGLDEKDVLYCSAKTGQGVRDVLPAIIERIASPESRPLPKLTADVADPALLTPAMTQSLKLAASLDTRILIFDSWYDVHRGVICLVYVASGTLLQGDVLTSYFSEEPLMLDVSEVGIVQPRMKNVGMLRRGQVGYVIAGIKNPKDAILGDTLYPLQKGLERASVEPLPGFVPSKSMVYAGIYGSSTSEFEELKKAVDRLTLTDGSVEITQESSEALGQGFRCGFRGMLAMDVWCQRLEQEFGASVIITAPTVPYKVVLKEAYRDLPKYDSLRLQSTVLAQRLALLGEDGQSTSRYVDEQNDKLTTVSEAMLKEQGALIVTSADQWPDESHLDSTYEPAVMSTVLTPSDCLGPMMQLFEHHRGHMVELTYITAERVLLKYLMPLSEVVTRFYFKVQTISSGFASFDFVPAGYFSTKLMKLELRLNQKSVDALSLICPKPVLETKGRALVTRLKKVLDRQQYEIVIQAATGSKILARDRIAPFRKDVLIKSGKVVGGGDQTRKTKLLRKQKEGKKRMKSIGNVDVNQEAFLAVVSLDD